MFTSTFWKGQLLGSLAAFVLAVSSASAANIDWTGGTSNDWGNSANWNAGAGPVPGVGDVAQFTAASYANQPNLLTSNYSVDGLLHSGTGTVYVQSLNSTTTCNLTLGAGGIDHQAGSGTMDIADSNAGTTISTVSVFLGANQTWTNNSSNLLRVNGLVNTSGYALTVNGSGNTTIGGYNQPQKYLGGTGSLTKDGTGTLTLQGTPTSNYLAGPVTINNGTVSLSYGVNLLRSSNVTVNSGGTLTFVNNGVNVRGLFGSGNVVTTGSLTLTIYGPMNGTFNGVISGTGNFQLQADGGSSTVTLAGNNTYTGRTLVAGPGSLSVSSLNSVSGPNHLTYSNLGAPTTTANGTIQLGGGNRKGTLIYTGTGETTDRVIDLYGTVGGTVCTLDMSGTGLLKFTSDFTATTASAHTLNLIGSTSGTGEIAGAIVNNSGTNVTSLTKNGTGTWTLSGTNSSFSGTTTIIAGTLGIASINNVSGGNSSLGAPTTTANGTIAIGSTTTTGQLTYIGTGDATDRVINLAGTTGGATLDQSGTGLLKFNSNFTATGGGTKTLTLQGSTAGTGEIAGVIPNNSGTNKTNVYKDGTGTWTLSGLNTYTGTTIINAGKLIAGSNSAFSTSIVTVNSGGTLVLAPGITLSNSITVNNGGYFGPQTTVGNGASYAGVTSTISTSVTGQLGTTLDLLAGTAGADRTLDSLWRARNASEGDVTTPGTTPPLPGNIYNLISDVVSFTGTGSDLYVLQLSYNEGQIYNIGYGENNLVTDGFLYLSYLNGLTYENGILGNTGNNATSAQQKYLGTFASFQTTYGSTLSNYIGAYGVDTTGNVAWAVVNHNSEWAVVPEPGTLALLAFGSMAVMNIRRKKKNS